MSTFLSKDVLASLKAAQKTNLKKKNRFHSSATRCPCMPDMINTIDNGIDIDFFKKLVLVLILIRRFSNYSHMPNNRPESFIN